MRTPAQQLRQSGPRGGGDHRASGLGATAHRPRLVGFFNDAYGRGGSPLLAIVYAAELRGTPRPQSDAAERAWFRLARLPLAEGAFPGIRRALRSYARDRLAARRPHG